MNYQRALITGGAGLIGSHIADRLVIEGYDEIVILDNFTRGRRQNLKSAAASGKLTFIEGDIRDAKLVRDVMEGVDIVFHEAAIRITQCAEDPRLAHDVLANGTFNILEAAVATHVKRIVYASSASIYEASRRFSHQRASSWLWEQDNLRSRENVRGGTPPQLLRDVWLGLCGSAVFQMSMVRGWTPTVSTLM